MFKFENLEQDNVRSATDNIVPLGHFDCLYERNIDPENFNACEKDIAHRPCLAIPSRSRKQIRKGYELPILKWQDIAHNLRIDVHVEWQLSISDSRIEAGL